VLLLPPSPASLELLVFHVLLFPLVFSEHHVSVVPLVYLVPFALTFFLELVALLVLELAHPYLVSEDHDLPAYLACGGFDDDLIPHSRLGRSLVFADIEVRADRNLTDHQFVSIHSI
jgi:hypothetical protein